MPYWLEEAYRRPINLSDTGLVQRNIALVQKSSTIIAYLFDCRGKFLDFAGGYGIYTRMMRDRGFDCCWHDKFSQNVFAAGFEVQSDIEKMELLTAFEVLEHLANPVDEIQQMLKFSRSILFSTLLLPEPVPGPDEWWYYGGQHGQHVSFYTLASLKSLGDRFGLHLYSDGGSLHLLSEKRFPHFLFPLLVKLSRFGVVRWKLRALTSRTIEDSEHMRLLEGS